MTDVVIAGTGTIECATAVQFLTADPDLDVMLVEPDPGYARAATRARLGRGADFDHPRWGGLQPRPGLAELILHGSHTTLGLQAMGYERIIDDGPYPERIR